MSPNNWTRADDLARSVAGGFNTDDPDAIGWEHDETGELILRTDRDGQYIVYYYTETFGSGRGMNQRLLFRSETPDIEDKLFPYLDGSYRNDRGYLNPIAIRSNEISEPQALSEWAHVYGAEYHGTEKIGNRKQSSGSVAIFDGSSRRGEGAYVALASETGPRGRDFISVGYQSNGHYTVDAEGFGGGRRKRAYEIESPEVEIDGREIHAESPTGSRTLTVTYTGDK